ncbi:MAG: TIM barrel protein [Phycisphaerales bacterium]|nr:TIM barrel protein [Phycisphaerales bacterium]
MPRLGVCSWSLQPSSAGDLTARILECGVAAVQLALDPIRTGAWDQETTFRTLRDNDITLLSGMMATKGEDYSTLKTIRVTGGVRPDETWPDNLAAAKANAELAERLGLSLVTLHAGFLPHDPADPERGRMIERLTKIAEIFESHHARVALETGQESADTLLHVLAELPDSVGVNFDPANMILYGMGDPIEALRKLAPSVAQIHLKDATPAVTPESWGAEVAAGRGAVDWKAFFQTYTSQALSCNLVIEREAGDSRITDVRLAAALARADLPGLR